MSRRCVVTGQDPTGKAVVVADSMLEAITPRPGIENYPIWGDDAPPIVPNDGSRPNVRFVFPPLGGYRFILTVIEPEAATEAQTTSSSDSKLQSEMGTVRYYDPDNPLMHTTDTVDVDYVVSGELW